MQNDFSNSCKGTFWPHKPKASPLLALISPWAPTVYGAVGLGLGDTCKLCRHPPLERAGLSLVSGLSQVTKDFLLFLREVAYGTVARLNEKDLVSQLQDPAFPRDRADLTM